MMPNMCPDGKNLLEISVHFRFMSRVRNLLRLPKRLDEIDFCLCIARFMHTRTINGLVRAMKCQSPNGPNIPAAPPSGLQASVAPERQLSGRAFAGFFAPAGGG